MLFFIIFNACGETLTLCTTLNSLFCEDKNSDIKTVIMLPEIILPRLSINTPLSASPSNAIPKSRSLSIIRFFKSVKFDSSDGSAG